MRNLFLKRDYRFMYFLIILTCYLVYPLLDEGLIYTVGIEDGVFEQLTFCCFLIACIFYLKAFMKNRNFFYLLFFLLFLFGAMEEISWGQRVFSYPTPEILRKINVQNEFTFHNIEFFNSTNFDNTRKQGLSKLFTVNFLYILFCFSYGFMLPLFTFINSKFRFFCENIGFPIPPLVIGIFFIFNWILFKFFSYLFYDPTLPEQYIDTLVEIMEFSTAYIFAIISFILFKKERKIRI